MLPINQSFNFFSHSAFALALFALALVTGCGSNSQAPPTLDSITLTPGSALVVLATTQQLDATGTLTNGTSGNVTDGAPGFHA